MFLTIANRSSDAIRSIEVNPISGIVFVEFTNGLMYEYSNVSRRAILNLILNPNMSLGFWVNANCVARQGVSFAAI